ncbi:ADP-ribose diphosphatase [Micromonospora saelicesensis]|uniref:ADP-ribose diphosphatase n=1 Tax=Micromonospora saelicesensis TaxID=285676 RepID=A0A328NNG3_9ACTN|nr:ADP-ribose diphosphatase [Micromonospora saelicesensis]
MRSRQWSDTGRVTEEQVTESTRWTIHGERVVDGSRRARLSIADVELPDGVRFEQYVIRAPRSVMVAVLDEQERLLLIRRHRFVFDRWVWELPGGYVDDGEQPAICAVREVEEETGWRPGAVEPLLSFQPWVATADAENLLFLARDAVHIGSPVDVNEAERVAWMPLAEARHLVSRGEIVGSGTVIAVLELVARKARGEL